MIVEYNKSISLLQSTVCSTLQCDLRTLLNCNYLQINCLYIKYTYNNHMKVTINPSSCTTKVVTYDLCAELPVACLNKGPHCDSRALHAVII